MLNLSRKRLGKKNYEGQQHDESGRGKAVIPILRGRLTGMTRSIFLPDN